MSSPVSGRRRRSRDWLHMEGDTAATSDAPPAGPRRVAMPVLVDGEILFYEFDYEPPRRYYESERLDYNDMDAVRRSWRQDLEDLDNLLYGPDRKRARAPASSDDDAAIRGLLREARAGDAGMPEECAVCLQDFDAKETLRVMPSCSHAFHPHCIFSWLRVKPACPMCRRALPTEQHKDQDFDDSSDEEDTDSDEDDTDSDEDDADGVNYQQESTPAVPDPEEP